MRQAISESSTHLQNFNQSIRVVVAQALSRLNINQLVEVASKLPEASRLLFIKAEILKVITPVVTKVVRSQAAKEQAATVSFVDKIVGNFLSSGDLP